MKSTRINYWKSFENYETIVWTMFSRETESYDYRNKYSSGINIKLSYICFYNFMIGISPWKMYCSNYCLTVFRTFSKINSIWFHICILNNVHLILFFIVWKSNYMRQTESTCLYLSHLRFFKIHFISCQCYSNSD